jgi:hypothetical protein
MRASCKFFFQKRGRRRAFPGYLDKAVKLAEFTTFAESIKNTAYADDKDCGGTIQKAFPCFADFVFSVAARETWAICG